MNHMIDLESLYQQAREHPSERRAFLKQVDFSGVSMYVNPLLYRRSDSESPITILHPSEAVEGLSGYKSTVVVHPLAFYEDYTPHLDDFLSLVVDFSGYVAKQVYLFPWMVIPEAHQAKYGRLPPNLDFFQNQVLVEGRAAQLEQAEMGLRELSPSMKKELQDFIQGHFSCYSCCCERDLP